MDDAKTAVSPVVASINAAAAATKKGEDDAVKAAGLNIPKKAKGKTLYTLGRDYQDNDGRYYPRGSVVPFTEGGQPSTAVPFVEADIADEE